MTNPLKRSNEEATNNSKIMKLMEVDHLAQLFDDCLFDILSRLNHDELDELATMSDRMRVLSELSRSKAMKVPAEELCISQGTNIQIIITLHLPWGCFFIDNSNDYAISGKMTFGYRGIDMKCSTHRPQQQIISDAVVNRALALLKRFDANSYYFDSVSIDIHFVRCIESLVSSHSFNSLTLESCVLDKNLDSNGRDKLLAILLAAKPASLSLECNSLLVGEEKLFMEKYARAVDLPELTIRERYGDWIDADQDVIETMTKFKSLRMPRLLVNCRLRKNAKGTWSFALSRIFLQYEITMCLEPGLNHTFKICGFNPVHVIGVEGTTNKAELRPQYSAEFRTEMLYVFF